MGGEEGNKPFTFNFFESESATGESPVSAAAEAAAQAQAEAEADAILAGGNLRGPRGEGGEEDWSYQEQAEELIGLPKVGQLRGHKSPESPLFLTATRNYCCVLQLSSSDDSLFGPVCSSPIMLCAVPLSLTCDPAVSTPFRMLPHYC